MENNAPPKNGQRAALRRPTKTMVTCRPYTSSGVGRETHGVIRNFSSNGSYIETSRPFQIGTILLMRTLRYPTVSPETTGDKRPRSICLAEVKWRHALAEDDIVRYGIGVRYLYWE